MFAMTSWRLEEGAAEESERRDKRLAMMREARILMLGGMYGAPALMVPR